MSDNTETPEQSQKHVLEIKSYEELIQLLKNNGVQYEDVLSLFDDGERIVSFTIFQNGFGFQQKLLSQIYFDKDGNKKYDSILPINQ